MLLLMAAGWLNGAVMAAPGSAPGAPAPLVIGGPDPVSLDGQPQVLAPRGSITIQQAAAGRLDGQMAPARQRIAALAPANELWIRFSVRNPSDRLLFWHLEFMLPSIDEVTLFEQRAGNWIETSAGDHIALAQWPSPSRFPQFALRFDPGEGRHFFIRVRNGFAAPLPLRLIESGAAAAAEQRSTLGFGLVLGTLGLLVMACLLQAAVYRDTAYFLYGTYALLLGLTFASLSGLAGLYLWGNDPQWSDASKSVFAVAAAGVSVWLIHSLCSVGTRARMLSRISLGIGALTIGMAILLAVLRDATVWLAVISVIAAVLNVMVIAVVTWRRQDAMGGWVIAAHAPMIAATVLISLRMYGLAPFDFDTNVVLSAAIGLILPLLLVAVSRRSKEILAVQIRARELASSDPLTGLLTPHLFRDRVRAAIGRYGRSRHNAIVLYVRLVNYAQVREFHGSAIAEQSVIRSAMKLQRLMPDADCMGRVGEATMGLIYESVTARAALMERASRLVAHGLMPLEGLKPEVILNFHIVCADLAENQLDAPQLQATMESALASMSPRTRRPIRFLKPGAVRLAAVGPDSDTEGGPSAASA
jgi:GGDEF domain-containing protein